MKKRNLSYQEWLRTTNALGQNKYEEELNRLADARGALGDPDKWRGYIEHELKKKYQAWRRETLRQ